MLGRYPNQYFRIYKDPTCVSLLLIDLSLSNKTHRCGDAHWTTGQLIQSQMLSICSLLATVTITNGDGHQFRRC